MPSFKDLLEQSKSGQGTKEEKQEVKEEVKEESKEKKKSDHF